MKHVSRYHEKREKNNIAVNKFRKEKSVKDLGKIKKLELVRILLRIVIDLLRGWKRQRIVKNTVWQVRQENVALETSAAVAKAELDQMTKIFEAHARFLF